VGTSARSNAGNQPSRRLPPQRLGEVEITGGAGEEIDDAACLPIANFAFTAESAAALEKLKSSSGEQQALTLVVISPHRSQMLGCTVCNDGRSWRGGGELCVVMVGAVFLRKDESNGVQ